MVGARQGWLGRSFPNRVHRPPSRYVMGSGNDGLGRGKALPESKGVGSRRQVITVSLPGGTQITGLQWLTV